MCEPYAKHVYKSGLKFDIDKIKSLHYDTENVALNREKRQIAYNAGYNDQHLTHCVTKMYTIYNCPPELMHVLEFFPNKEYSRLRVRITPPGGMLKAHVDPFSHFLYVSEMKENFDVDVPMLDDYSNFRRGIMFLEDHKPGHFSVCMEKMFYEWKSGDYVFWGLNMHAAGNFGEEDRYVIGVDYVI